TELSRHLLFGIALAFIIGLYFFVSQVRTIVLQALSMGAGGYVLHEIGLILLSLVGAVFFVGSVVEVIPWDLTPKGFLGRILGPCATLVDKIVWPIQRGLGWLADRRYPAGLPVLLLGILMFVAGAKPGGGRWFPLAGAICKNFAVLFTAVGGAVVLTPRLLRRVPNPAVTAADKIAFATCRYLAWLVVCMLIGETIWFVDGILNAATYSGFTIWAFLQVGLIMVVGAS